MGLFSLHKLFGITIRESATDGSDFTNPDADYRRLFLGEDGQLHVKDAAGAVTSPSTAETLPVSIIAAKGDLIVGTANDAAGILTAGTNDYVLTAASAEATGLKWAAGGGGGSVATDAIWDAAGDLAVGTGADTATKLTKGAAGTVPTAGASTLAYAFPPGHEFDYAENASVLNCTAATEAAADTLVSGAAVTYDGSTAIIVEFFAPNMTTQAVDTVNIWLYDGASSIGQLAKIFTGTAVITPISAKRRLTPSNASHTYSIRVSVTGTGGSPNAFFTLGSGGAGNHMPGFIRITKA